MRRTLIACLVFFTAATLTSAKDFKVGYINSQRILEEFQESQEAQRTLDDEQRQWLADAKKMEDEIKAMEDELESQSLLISEEKKAEKLQEIQKKYMEYQQFQQEIWGENGKLYQRNKELTQPIIDKVNAVIRKIGEEGDYDIIFDATMGNIVYAKDEYDLTEIVLDDLNK
jgi:outer membrane protein